eukprot:CAMPEP_0170852614 /NCGR_PEP_ID=MMETSP0734-20130129/11987_1 /TAXON_ID=186038 /ORGANISM="Fragilariopsis kerguelensis, Strain L26-C5" /LENGTH=130 /DNA_ID=CAMNT_0011223065 /DNA_START=130 /DNA_END=522 /DNA_ORIENTATION=+
MTNETTSLKNVTPAGDSNITPEMVIGKSNTYQRPLLIVTGSLLLLLAVIAVAGTSGGQHFQSSAAQESAEGAVTLTNYQVDSAYVALTKDMFGVGAVSENEGCCEGFWPFCGCTCLCCFNKKRSICVFVK